MSLQSFNKYLNPSNLPVEQMSNQNAIGANTGYPMADMQTPAYAVPRNIPQAQNVISGDQDVRVDPYTGEEKFAAGGGVMDKAMNMGDKLYQFLIGKGEYPGITKQEMPTVTGQQLYDQSGKAMPRYQLNPDGTFSLVGAKEEAQQALGPKYVAPSQSSSASYFNNPENRSPLPRTPAGVEKPWNEWTAEEKAQWAQENPGLASFDAKVHNVVDPLVDFTKSGGFTGAVLGGLGSLLNSGVGTSVNERNPAAISAYNQQPGLTAFFNNLFSGTTGNNAPIVEGSGTDGAAPSLPSETSAPAATRSVAPASSGYQPYTPTGGGYTGMSYGSDSGSSDGGGSSGAFSGGFGGGSSDARGGYLSDGKFDQRPTNMAQGGISSLRYNLGSYSDGGRLLKGPGDGVSDDIPAMIEDRQPARLANNEFVIPARIVSEIGQGSTDAGAKKLYEMMDRVQAARKKTIGKGKIAVDSKAYKELDKL